ncbi:MAG: 2-amino-4-hydroxy-6-hydroxymethyldihydropteridine diphosphokinase [Leptolyngbyaceae cyanobacterium]
MTLLPSAIALGSNLGDSAAILQGAITALRNHPHIRVTAVSDWYETAPVGPPQPNYLNGCALLETDLAPEELLRVMLAIETQFGRQRRERWGPRHLDLDLLFFGDVVMTTPTLQIPHPHLQERAFVLVPLAEIAPTWQDPISGLTVAALLRKVDTSGVEWHAPFSGLQAQGIE